MILVVFFRRFDCSEKDIGNGLGRAGLDRIG